MIGQSGNQLEPNSRVRLRITPDNEQDRGDPVEIRGRVVSYNPDTLVVRMHSAISDLVIPTAWIDRLEISRGPASAAVGAWRGARAAFMLGGVIGGVVGGEIASMGHESFFDAVPKRIALYGLASGISGAVLGAMSPGEEWAEISIHLIAARGHSQRLLLGLSFPSQ
ncbi:MAG TPA: hypothetical protein VFI91_04495 [Longimicrobiaceae bacterium]|nr:hypothetical protein [Longimicrobiaceae bacterium]